MIDGLCQAISVKDPIGDYVVSAEQFAWRPTKVGNSILLCGRKDTVFPRQLFIGPNWICMCITYLLIIAPAVLFCVNVAPYWGIPIIVVGVFLLVLTVW